MMLRDLATVIEDLHHGLQAAAQRAGMRLARAEMTLPVDTTLVLRDGSCVLLADVARHPADAQWQDASSRLSMRWAEFPTDALAAGDLS
jgi:hypothetical protein